MSQPMRQPCSLPFVRCHASLHPHAAPAHTQQSVKSIFLKCHDCSTAHLLHPVQALSSICQPASVTNITRHQHHISIASTSHQHRINITSASHQRHITRHQHHINITSNTLTGMDLMGSTSLFQPTSRACKNRARSHATVLSFEQRSAIGAATHKHGS